jgi:hypothetical protein
MISISRGLLTETYALLTVAENKGKRQLPIVMAFFRH